MSSVNPSARDTALSTMRRSSAALAIAGLALTGGVAGLFARELQPAPPAERGPSRGQARQMMVVVHDPAPAGGAGGAPAAPGPAAAIPATVPAAPSPAVSAPAAPAPPAATSSGSDS